MKRKITILRQYFLELIEATERRDFVAMNEIYCEIESIMHNKTLNNIFLDI